jgi:hypothetical protein
MECTKCKKPIAAGQKYHRTKRGPHHRDCSLVQEAPAVVQQRGVMRLPWEPQEPVTVKDLCGPVAQGVHQLEVRCKNLDDLCGAILACLKVNRLRGTLTSADDKQLDGMIELWITQHQAA